MKQEEDEWIRSIARAQYQRTGNLNARIQMHQLYSTNPTGWFPWYFEHLALPYGSRILELGCGVGAIWRSELERIPADWRMLLTDFSAGMIAEARAQLPSAQFSFSVVDAQAIPLLDATFDAVLANQMLYHVPDRARAIAEIYRVLRPGGTLYAATNGTGHMAEMFALEDRLFGEHSTAEAPRFWGENFTLENGAAQISQAFPAVTARVYPDSLEIRAVPPLIDYLFSMHPEQIRQVSEMRLHAFAEEMTKHIEREGSIHVGKHTGILIAQKPD